MGRFVTDPQPEHKAVRHPGDLVRVALAAGVLAVATPIAATHKVGRLEEDVFRFVNRLPEFLKPPLTLVMQCGTLGAVGVATAAALVTRKTRLARDLLIGGAGAWLAAKVVKSVVGRERPIAILDSVFRHATTDTGLGYPSGHSAVAAALATIAAPYVGRRTARTFWAGAVVVGVARVFVGAHLPLDVIGGWALGWLIGSVVHLAFGAPVGGPSFEAVSVAVERVAGTVTNLKPMSVDARGSEPYRADTVSGAIVAKVLTTANRDADALFKLFRFLMYRQIGDEAPFASAQHVAEHEAYATVMAERSGARVAHLRGSTRFDKSAVLIIDMIPNAQDLEQIANGRSGEEMAPTLVDTWRQVAALHAARIAHRDLRLANIVVGSDGQPTVIDFGFAEVAAEEPMLAIDIAEFLVATSLAFGQETAVAAAAEGIGDEALTSALPYLQPLALSSATRSTLRSKRHALANLRAAVTERVGVAAPKLVPLARVRLSAVAVLLVLGLAVHLLLPNVGTLDETVKSLRSAQWQWLVGLGVASVLTYLFAAVALIGASPVVLPFGRTVVAELASSFANRFVPLGSVGVVVRYLQRHGLDGVSAGATVATVDLAGFSVHVPLLLLAAVATGRTGVASVKLPSGWIVLVIGVVLLALSGLMAVPAIRLRVQSSVSKSIAQLKAVLREPRRALKLWLGSLGITSSYIIALAMALAAFGAHASFEKVALVYLAGSAIASAAPTPGGLGAVEAALVAGLTATGVASGPAIAGVLTFRLATFWIPTLPGWVAFTKMRRRGEL
jgi:undecaprenyl-diphosphatase